MLKRRLLLLICFFWAIISTAQKTETHKLLNQAAEMVFYNPKEAKTIAEYTLNLSENPAQKAKANHVSATASYIMGQYDEALRLIFQSNNLLKEAKDTKLHNLNNALTRRVFKRLQLSDEPLNQIFKDSESDDLFAIEDLLTHAHHLREQGQTDSVEFYINRAETLLNFENPGYLEVIYFHLKGDLLFEKKEFSQALEFYKKSRFIENKIKNPFLGEETHIRLAASYLAVDSISEYQQSSEVLKQLMNESSEIENRASNQAYTLLVKSMDEEFIQREKRFKSLLIGLGILVILGIGLKILFSIRNKNKEKSLTQILDYLKKLELNSKKAELELIQQKSFQNSLEDKEEKLDESDKKEISLKTGNLLKESEEQILLGLTKFENSKKFTQKDMSLGKLAVRLNTNTKYLSEVINRHKGKNFNAYINELRINYITEKLKSEPAYLNYKVSYLAEESGFSSHSSFATVFKSIVGVSPSIFIDFLKDENLKIKEVS